eukprot:8329399-Karenia_brevis.AAC.1
MEDDRHDCGETKRCGGHPACTPKDRKTLAYLLCLLQKSSSGNPTPIQVSIKVRPQLSLP